MSIKPVIVYLSLGSNIGNRQDNLDKGLRFLSQKSQMIQVSSIYDTEPLGVCPQPHFLNLVCQIYTEVAPLALLILVKGIELKLGRTLSESNCPRTLDIDILFYGDQIFKNPKLVIPHPRLAERDFTLVPLAEIAPDLVHPVIGKTVSDLLKGLNKETRSIMKWKSS